MNLTDMPILHGSGSDVLHQGFGSAFAGFRPAGLPTVHDLRPLVADASSFGLIALEPLHALLAALERRDHATAQHSYRTACWCAWMGASVDLPRPDAAALVVAALFHDIGKLGIEDAILLKPGALTASEFEIMRQHDKLGAQMLAACRASPKVVQTVEQSHRWFAPADATAPDPVPLSLAARILAVAEAYDTMTSDWVYRKAMSREEAVAKLQQAAGQQFDPDVVALFAAEIEQLPTGDRVPRGSLHDLIAADARGPVEPAPSLQPAQLDIEETMNLVSDAVCMVDAEMRIRLWNQRAEKLTGYSASDMVGRRWTGEFIDYSSQLQQPPSARRTLISRCLDGGVLLTERGYLWTAQGQCVPVESRVVPLRNEQRQVTGAIEVIRDLSTEVALQSENAELRRVSDTDPLTQVLNRNAFNRLLREQVAAVTHNGSCCSLILLDLDFFKSINDTFGHPAGDVVLKALAKLLGQCCRPTDAVARYGGEEFAMLLPGCNLASAYDRAEQVRQGLASLRLPEIKGQHITVSSGVTEIHAEDSDSAVVARADEALYRSKKHGRNRTEVGYADTGPQNQRGSDYRCSWTFAGTAETALLKLSGFVASHGAKTVEFTQSSVRLRIGQVTLLRRMGLQRGDMPVEIHLAFSRTHISERSQVHVAIRSLIAQPQQNEFHRRCTELLIELRSYFMADEAAEESSGAAS